MTHSSIPFIDLAGAHRALEDEILEAIRPLIRNAAFIGGDPVIAFERAFAAAHAIPHAVTVKSGTAALELGLRALGVGPGDEVVVPAFTFVATAAAVLHAGARPVFADVEPETALLDPGSVEAVWTDRTRALIPVHLYGHPAPLAALSAIARRQGARLLEDCAQSHLARGPEGLTGTLGDAAAFSFYPTKNLGAAGDAGCVLTADAETAAHVRRLANHGRTEPSLHAEAGWNERLDALQAAVLQVKLRRLPEWTSARRRAAQRYRELLDGIAPYGTPLRLPVERPGAEPVYHLYVVRHPRRDDLARELRERGIGSAVHYPLAVPDQPAFRGSFPADVPVARAWSATCLALPLYPEITPEAQERVAAALRAIPG
jgi:dTDP-4-amino-4,6-dideoxygalactose transaminase